MTPTSPNPDVLAAAAEMLSDAYQRAKAENTRLAAELRAAQQTIRRQADDLDGMHLCNEQLWAEREALRRELVEERAR